MSNGSNTLCVKINISIYKHINCGNKRNTSKNKNTLTYCDINAEYIQNENIVSDKSNAKEVRTFIAISTNSNPRCVGVYSDGGGARLWPSNGSNFTLARSTTGRIGILSNTL